MGIWVFGCLGISATASPLDDKIQAFDVAQTQTEGAVAGILQAGLAEHRSAEAFAAVRSWLSANPTTDQTLLFRAGKVAEYAGEWSEAVSFYRRLLSNDKLNGKLAAEAVPAVYRLLISHMRKENVAYLFMRQDGSRLRRYGRAKQFDHWFLKEAHRRNDLIAVAEYLAAIYNSDGEYAPLVSDNLNALLSRIESYNHDGAELFAALKQLAKAKKTTPQTRARLNWVMEIVPAAREMVELFKAKKELPDELLAKPLKAAEQLVAVLPAKGSKLVARGWMQFGPRHSPYVQNFVNIKRKEKMAPLFKTLPALEPTQLRDVLRTRVPNSRNRRIVDYLFTRAELRGLVRRVPAAFNTPEAPAVPLWEKSMTVEEAKALAPHLARNPHGHAALIRAYAAAGEKKMKRVLVAMAKSESWRFVGDERKSAARRMVDKAWNSGLDREGVDHGKIVKHYEEQLDKRMAQLKKQVSKEANSKERLAAFKALYQQLRDGKHSTPGLLGLWNELFSRAPDADRIAMLKTLTSDFAAAKGNAKSLQKYLLSRAIQQMRFGNKYSMFAFGPDYYGHWERHGYKTMRERLPEFEVFLRQMLRKQMQAGTLIEEVFGMWLHCVAPHKKKSRTFMEELMNSPAYAKLGKAYHRMAAHERVFGTMALTEKLPNNPHVVSRELLDLPKDPTQQQVAAALKTVVTRLRQLPKPGTVIAVDKVAASEELDGETRKLALSIFGENAPLGDYPRRQGYEHLVVRLVRDMQKEERWGDIEPYVANFWRSAKNPDHHNRRPVADALTAFAEAALAKGASSVVSTVARTGFQSRGVPGLDPNDSRHGGQQRVARLRQVSGKAGLAIGVFEIPVDKQHPDYPLYKSNAEFAQGNLESAWELYKNNASRLIPKTPRRGEPDTAEKPLLQKLPVDYSLWLLRRNMDVNGTDRAENLIRALMIWSRQAEGTFNQEQEAELRLAYADLAFRDGKLPTARAWYRKVADAREYKGSEMQVRAILGMVRVDRAAKNFGSAMTELDKLMQIRDPQARIKAHYARAEVLMDQENFKEAFDEIQTVLRRKPAHADALILRGKIQYQMRKLVDASEIELGITQQNKIIVPGETLKINLHDPTLSISGLGVDIEVTVTAKSGDKERVMLYQFGDDKERFRAEIPTALAPPVPGDNTLQVLGVDEIRYGYSKRFRAKMDDLPPDPDVVIGVAADAHLSLSAGAFPPREGERRLNIEELGLSTAQRALGTRTVRPGNPIYLRVIDADKSKTPKRDQLSVSLYTTSGDVIRNLPIKETGPYTGEFEATIPTASAQAMAFASESAPGRNPNMAISARDYPGWQGKPGDKEKKRTFGIDLNDNVAVDTMSIAWNGGESKLTHFVLQTSMNGKDWTTRGRYPKDGAPWDGRPQITSFPTHGRNAMGVATPQGRDIPKDWQEKMDLSSARGSINYVAKHVPGLASMKPELANGGHPNYSVLMRYRALFYQPAAAVRRFRLEGYPNKLDKGKPRTIFLLDGQPADEESDDPLTIERELKPGLHVLEVWCHDSRNKLEKRKPKLLCDVPGEENLKPCPDSMFDPSTFPDGVKAQIPQPAQITQAEDRSGLDITFGDRTQARMARLVIFGFKGVAPQVKSVTLKDRDGEQLLPVKQDFMKLRENEQLEVLPGDKITARYEDDTPATPNRRRHEQRLGVAYNTARITTSFLNYETTREGERVLKLEQIRRFKFDDAIAVVIDDPDMDGTPKHETAEFKVETSEGVKKKMKAVETEEHSGRFIGRVFPVAGKPERNSEIQLPEGGTLTATYRDMENLDPGIPADRSTTIEHAQYSTPKLAVYNISSEALPPPPVEENGDQNKSGPEVVRPRRALDYNYIGEGENELNAADTRLQGVIGASLRFDLVVPHHALAGSSVIHAYAQVDPGDQAKGDETDQPFNIELPGTLKLTGKLQRKNATAPRGYKLRSGAHPPTNTPSLEEGRFAFSVPLILADKPMRSYATKEAESLPRSSIPEGVVVQAGDTVRIGYAYKDENDELQWKTSQFKVVGHAFLDVMNDSYNSSLTKAFVGEKVYVRVLGRNLDHSPARDETTVSLKAASGAATTFKLRETQPHSGMFKGVFALSYADAELPDKLPPVALNGFPVRYGDEVVISYPTGGGASTQTRTVTVNMGADGTIKPFTKRYTGDEMAVKTTFTLSECFFELAKKHRKMQRESLARREIGHARKLLHEAIATHREDELKAHAEYLLGNLAQEYADLAQNEAAKLPMYQDALARFSKIPTDYPETEFAPKGQFKTALVYEKMGETENAVEEYVKLAYKYPDSELIPKVMARLGAYFQRKGQVYKKKADPLREKEDAESKSEVVRLDELARPEFIKAAQVFAKLQERFPTDDLAGLAGLRAGQNYMRARQYGKAIDSFDRVINTEEYDGRDIRAQALYWSGLSYERIVAGTSKGNWKGRGKAKNEAYQIYRRITFDFPDSKWAKFARGRLADPAFEKKVTQEAKKRESLLQQYKER